MSKETYSAPVKAATSLRAEYRRSRDFIETHFYANSGYDGWDFYGEPFSEYASDFGTSAPDFIDKIKNTQDPVVVDFMSPTDALVDSFENHPSKHKLGIAVSLTDTRLDDDKKRRDEAINVHLVTGNLSSGKTWKEVQKVLGQRKADVIVERAYGALDLLPSHPRFYAMAITRAWDMLSTDNGLLIAQTFPLSSMKYLGVNVEGWLSRLNENGITVSWQDSLDRTIGVLCLTRKPNNPVKIPLL